MLTRSLLKTHASKLLPDLRARFAVASRVRLGPDISTSGRSQVQRCTWTVRNAFCCVSCGHIMYGCLSHLANVNTILLHDVCCCSSMRGCTAGSCIRLHNLQVRAGGALPAKKRLQKGLCQMHDIVCAHAERAADCPRLPLSSQPWRCCSTLHAEGLHAPRWLEKERLSMVYRHVNKVVEARSRTDVANLHRRASMEEPLS